VFTQPSAPPRTSGLAAEAARGGQRRPFFSPFLAPRGRKIKAMSDESRVKKTPRSRKPTSSAARKRAKRLKTSRAEALEALCWDRPAKPKAAAAPPKERSGPAPTSIAAALRELKNAAAPPEVAAALGLGPNATNAECIAKNLIAKASMPNADVASIRETLDRLEGKVGDEAGQLQGGKKVVRILMVHANPNDHAYYRALAPAILQRCTLRGLWAFLDRQLEIHLLRADVEAARLRAASLSRAALRAEVEKAVAAVRAGREEVEPEDEPVAVAPPPGGYSVN
jgi:hypothetical protein